MQIQELNKSHNKEIAEATIENIIQNIERNLENVIRFK